MDQLGLLDYRRRVSDLYSRVRRESRSDARAAWAAWAAARDELFREHPQGVYHGGGVSRHAYYPYDAALRVRGVVEAAAEAGVVRLAHSAGGSTAARCFGRVRFVLGGVECVLPVYWLEQYGGGIFLPFQDETSGGETYGGGRYLLDSAKSADLGQHDDGALVLDFNFAYHPSCFHSDAWSCPLAAPGSRLAVAVRGGEKYALGPAGRSPLRAGERRAVDSSPMMAK